MVEFVSMLYLSNCAVFLSPFFLSLLSFLSFFSFSLSPLSPLSLGRACEDDDQLFDRSSLKTFFLSRLPPSLPAATLSRLTGWLLTAGWPPAVHFFSLRKTYGLTSCCSPAPEKQSSWGHLAGDIKFIRRLAPWHAFVRLASNALPSYTSGPKVVSTLISASGELDSGTNQPTTGAGGRSANIQDHAAEARVEARANAAVRDR